MARELRTDGVNDVVFACLVRSGYEIDGTGAALHLEALHVARASLHVGVTDHLARATRYLLGNFEVRSEVVFGQDASMTQRTGHGVVH